MIGWIVRFIFVIAGFITSFFIAKDALNFQIIQMTVAVILFTSIVIIIAFWPSIKALWKRSKNK